MKNLQFSYVMKTIFIEEITEHSFTLKCVPGSDASQTVQTLDFHLMPSADMSKDTDAFGNRMLYGRVREGHDIFVVQFNGKVLATGNPIPEPDEKKTWIYKYPTSITTAGEYLKNYFKKIKSQVEAQGTKQQQAEYLMHGVYGHMYYQPSVTGMSTTAEEAFTIGKGVCQDYAHILLTLLRLCHIPARYVVGMMEGEGASHAWVEGYMDGAWCGFDPTNDKKVDDTYIRISQGRDSKDCLVERGIYLGNENQQKLVGVKVIELEE